MTHVAKVNTFRGFSQWGCPGVEEEPCQLGLAVWSCTSFHPEQEGGSWRGGGSTGLSPGVLQPGPQLPWLTPRRTSRPRLPGKRCCSGGSRCPCAETEPPQEQPWPGRAPGPGCFLPAWRLRGQPAAGWLMARTSLCHPRQAEHRAGASHACSQEIRARLWKRGLGWGRARLLAAGPTWRWGNISCGRTLLRPEQEPSSSSEQAEVLLSVLSIAPTAHIFQLVQSIFPWEGKRSLDKEVFVTKGGDSANYQFHRPRLGTPLHQGRTLLLMVFAYLV